MSLHSALEQREGRQLIELTLKSARKRLSKQTGLVHLCYESLPGEPHETIPLFENACFALALFKSRLSEDVQEGKSLLNRLLCFEAEGNFPVYLHEYPVSKDSFLSLKLLSVFLPILKQFSTILGEDLLCKLLNVIERIKTHALQLKDEKELPKQMLAKVHALCGFEYDMFSWQPRSSKEWGEWVLTFSLFSISEEKKEAYMEPLTQLWNSSLFLYQGAETRPHQDKGQPAFSLFDLFMCLHSGEFPKRFIEDNPLHLQAALIPFYPEWQPVVEKNTSDIFSLRFYETLDPLWLLAWGNSDCVHSLACVTNVEPSEKSFDGKKLVFTLDLPKDKASEEGFDLSFFCSRNPECEVLVQGQKATTFHIGETIEIISTSARLKILCEKLEGEGNFFGHLSIANRPGQLANRGDMRFEAYDWHFGLRSVDRHSPCQLKITLELQEQELQPKFQE